MSFLQFPLCLVPFAQLLKLGGQFVKSRALEQRRSLPTIYLMSKPSLPAEKATQGHHPSLAPKIHPKTTTQPTLPMPNHFPPAPTASSASHSSIISTARTRNSPQPRRSLNSQHNRPTPTDHDASLLQKKTDTTRGSTDSPQFFAPEDQKSFVCPDCFKGNIRGCTTCRDNRSILPGHSLIQFLSYVIDFKLGRRPSYSPPTHKPKEEGLHASHSGRLAQSQRISMVERRQECANIHYGYCCDQCGDQQPIRGTRFHCLVCDDYDLCSQCNKKGHKHPMAEIPFSASYRHSLRTWEALNHKQQGMRQSEKGSGVRQLQGRISGLEQQLYRSTR